MSKRSSTKKLSSNGKNLDSDLRVRVNDKDLKQFMKKSESVAGKPYQIFVRELISAFNDDRLRIIKTDGQKKNTIYVTR